MGDRPVKERWDRANALPARGGSAFCNSHRDFGASGRRPSPLSRRCDRRDHRAPGRFRTAPEFAKVERRTRKLHSMRSRWEALDGDRTLAVASTLEHLDPVDID